jgi:predicted permease
VPTLRFALRQLIKTPAFSVVALVTLALGIGVNSALFTVVNSLLFRSRGVTDPATLVDVYQTSPGFRYSTVSYPDYVDVRDQNTVFSGVALYQLQALGFSQSERTKTAWTEVVSGNYFDVLGVRMTLGRGFDPARDDVPGAAPVVVLSHAFWQRELAGDPAIVGRTVRLNGASFEVLGVAAPDFRGMIRGLVAGLWIPAGATPHVFPGSTFLTERANHNSFIRARLKPGATVAEAAANLDAIGRRLAETYPVSNAGRDLLAIATADVTLNPLVDGMVSGAAVGMLVIPGLVLLIACANLATLFLTRATGRRRELAVRVALGAGRGQVVRQLLVESLLLSLAGGGLGLLVCAWLANLLVRFQPPLQIPVNLDLTLDWRVFLFTALIAVGTGVFFGLAPAVRASRPDLTGDLREGNRGSAARSRLRAGLVAAQLAVSVVLLVGSALLLRSLAGAARLDLGFDASGAATIAFDPQQQGYDESKSLAFLDELIRRARALPGVSVVSMTTRPPLNLNVSTNEIVAEGAEPVEGRYPEIQRATVGADYFQAIGATIAAGREFTDRDRSDQPLVVIVNEAAADLLWPGGSPLGRRVATRLSGGPGQWREVVGVVKNVKVVTVGERPTPQIFFPVYQSLDSYLTVIARTRESPAVTAEALRRILAELDPGIPVMGSGALQDQVHVALFPVRFAAMLLTVLGLAGLAIAAIGLYGIIAQGVAARTRELGIRIALGAPAGDVRRMVLVDGLRLAGLGLGLGVVIAAASSRVLRAWLYGVSALDPLAFLVAPAVLLLVAAAACLIPATRATRVDPVNALKSE